MTDFALHERLAADTVPVCEMTLSSLRLMKDARYPWVMLIPRIPEIREMHQLAQADQRQLMVEITRISAVMEREWGADKMNVGALGNMVPQLHIHIIARFEGDAAWPGPVWGVGAAVAYQPDALDTACSRLNASLRAA